MSKVIITNDLSAEFNEIMKLTADGIEVIVTDSFGNGEAPDVKTGHLRDSIYSEVDGSEVIVGSTADYALFLEVGTEEIEPKPFLRHALNQAFDVFVEKAKEVL